jgi:DNA-binding PucR family transcriptional regulator
MLQRDVLVQMLEGAIDDRYEFTARAAFAGIEIDEPSFLVVARRTASVDAGRSARLGSLLNAHLRRWPRGVVQSIAGMYVFVLPAARARADELESFVATIGDVVEDGVQAFLVTHSAEPLLLDQFPREWQRSRQTIELAEKLDRSGVVDIHDFGAYRVLLAALQGQDIAEFIRTTLGPLLDADRDGHSELFDTAEAFASSSGRFQETARRLHIHVSTLRYRLARVAVLLGRDLSDEEVRFEVSLAARLERLRRGL